MKWAFAVACAATASADEGSPIGKVIQMISDLEAKVIGEGEAIQKTYEEVSLWCEERSRELSQETKTAKGQILNLKASIEKAVADIQTETASIEELAGETAAAQADLDAATKIREKENADFVAFEADLAETIDTLERAIGIIEKEMAGGAAMVQFKQSGGVIQALKAMVAAEAISTSDGQKLTALVQSNSESDDDDTGAPDGAVFENSSGGITDVLNDLLGKANAELESAREREKSSLQNFEMLSMSLTDQIKFATKEMAEAKKSLAESQELKASAEGDLGVSTGDLNEDTRSLAGIHHDCMSKANVFEAEVKSRGEELKALATAKKIVIEATSMAQTSDSFLQITTRSDLVSFEAIRFVRDLSKKQHSTALAQLASRMDTTARFGGSDKNDVFTKIKGLLNDMIAKLEAEAAADATEKAFCDKELAETTAKKTDKTDEIEKLSAKIDKLTSESKILKSEVAGLEAQLGELIKSQAEMDKIRQEEKATFEANHAELNRNLAGIQKALKVLNEYYAKPSFHGNSDGSSTGIIGLLEVCEADFSKEIAEISDAESTSAYTYEQESKENEATKVAKEQDVKYKTKAAASLDKSVSEYTSDRSGVETELSAVNEYLKELNARCSGRAESYAERKARREEEIAGLKEAMTVLENETALLQTTSKHFMSVRRH